MGDCQARTACNLVVDVARVLGFKYPRDAVKRVPEQWVKIVTLDLSVEVMSTLEQEFDNRVTQITVLEEAGIYSLVFRSKLPSAITFQKWVFEDVLPQIRATGVYVPKPKLEEHLSTSMVISNEQPFLNPIIRNNDISIISYKIS